MRNIYSFLSLFIYSLRKSSKLLYKSSRIEDYKQITNLFKNLFKSTKPSIKQSNELFNRNLNSKNPSIDTLVTHYNNLKTSSNKDFLDNNKLSKTLSILSKQSSPFLDQFCEDIRNHWKLELSRRDFQFIIQAYVNQRRINKAVDIVRTLDNPSLAIFSVLLTGCSTHNDYNAYQRVLSIMEERDIKPDLHIYNARLKLAFQYHDIDVVDSLLEDLKMDGYQPDLFTHTILLDGYSRLHQWSRANESEAFLRSSDTDIASWTCILLATGRQHGLEKAKEVVDEIFSAGLSPNDIALSHLVGLSQRPSSSEDAKILIDDLSAYAGVEPGKHTYRAALEHLLMVNLDEAYEFCISIPDQRSLPVTLPLITALAGNKDGTALDNLRKMLSIYDQLDRERLDTRVLAHMLRTCAKAGDVQTAIDILVDMKTNSVDLESQFTTSFIVTLLHASSDYYQAFRLYANVVDSKATRLDAAGFSTIIAEFCGLKFQDENIVPAVLFSEILNDMRKAGYPPDCKTYTSLLDYYAHVRDNRSIAKIETLLNVDRSIMPDIYLHNALLNAHNRVGNGGKCVELYNALLFSRRADNASLSIALDVSGSRNTPADSIHIWNLSKKYIKPNRKNWETLIEALVRRRRFSDARNVTFNSEEFKPDTNAIEILFRMTRASRDEKEITILRNYLLENHIDDYNAIKNTVDIPWKE